MKGPNYYRFADFAYTSLMFKVHFIDRWCFTYKEFWKSVEALQLGSVKSIFIYWLHLLKLQHLI